MRRWKRCVDTSLLTMEEANEAVMTAFAAEFALEARNYEDMEEVCSEGEDWEDEEMDSLEEALEEAGKKTILNLDMPSGWWSIEMTMNTLKNGKKIVSMVTRDTGGTVYVYFRRVSEWPLS